MPEKQTTKERLKQITDSIEAGIQELFQSEKYMQYLRTMSRFHHYSINNTMLIHMQKPDATLVAGFKKWKNEFSRNVMRGEKGIKIIAPTPFKKKIETEKLDPDTRLPLRDEDGNIIFEEKVVKIPMFKPVTVFDVSQTEGKPLPTLASDLKGDVQHYEVFMEALRRSSPVPMVVERLAPDTDGYFSRSDQRIAIREGMSEVQTVSAAVHEIAHAKLHNYMERESIDDIEEYEQVEIFDQPALFTNGRVDREKLPEGLYCYDLRGSDDDTGDPATLEYRVAVNHAGSVITAKPIELPEAGYLSVNDGLNFLGEKLTLRSFYETMLPDKVEKDRRTKEVEAESVSFAVCAYYGIETGENSFGYIASWSKNKELKELRASLETIHTTADSLIGDIDRNFREICQERGIDLSGEGVCADEQFYKVNEAQYLHIQRCDSGYDYTFYNAADKTARDGGQLDDPGLTIRAAAERVCEMNNILMDGISVIACELPEEFVSAASATAPRDYHAELADHFAREDDKLWDTKLDEFPLPDNSVSEEELHTFGYKLGSMLPPSGSMLPLSKERAIELLKQDNTVYMLYSDGSEAMAFKPEELTAHDGMFGMELDDWLKSRQFKKAVAERLAHQQERETAFLEHSGDCFAIYQIKLDDDNLYDLRYMGLDHLKQNGLSPDRANYDLAYTGELAAKDDLNTIWERFNIDHPLDYMRPSLSVSDIVAMKRDGVLSCYYVDSLGFQELPGFLKAENSLKTVEEQVEDDYNMLDGVINNGQKQPTVAELEAMVKAGQPISLLDYAEALKREKDTARNDGSSEKRESVLAKIRKPLSDNKEKKTESGRSAEREWSL